MSEEEQEYLARLLETKKTYEDSLTGFEKQLELESKLSRLGNSMRELRGYHMGQDLGNNPPCGVKYLENLEHIIIPRLVSNIYSANSNIERLTSQIEKLTGVALPVAEEVAADGRTRRRRRRRKSRRRRHRTGRRRRRTGRRKKSGRKISRKLR